MGVQIDHIADYQANLPRLARGALAPFLTIFPKKVKFSAGGDCRTYFDAMRLDIVDLMAFPV